VFGSSHDVLFGDRLTPSIFISKRPDEWSAVVFPAVDRFNRINNALGYPISENINGPSVNPKRDGEPHEHSANP